MERKEIFQEVTINGHVATNRIIRSATNDHLGNPDGTVSEAQIEMYRDLASNEVGTIITGHMSVSPDLDYRADEMQLCIGEDKYISGLRQIPKYNPQLQCTMAECATKIGGKRTAD